MFAGFKRALAAKLPAGFGTDAGVIEHGENWKEFAVRHRLGESNAAAIVAATSLNAEIIGWQDRVGTVEAGKFADLIAVPGDPLQDIAVLGRVEFRDEGRDGLPRRACAAVSRREIRPNDHLGRDFLGQLGGQVFGQVAHVLARVELNDIRADDIGFQREQGINHLSRRKAARFLMRYAGSIRGSRTSRSKLR